MEDSNTHPSRSNQLLKTKTFRKSTAIRRNGNTQPGFEDVSLKSFVHKYILTIIPPTYSLASRHPTQQHTR